MNEMFNALAPLCAELSKLPGLDVKAGEPLDRYTRFGIGGPAGLLITAHTATAFMQAFRAAGDFGVPREVIGGGTNLIVSDRGFPGVVLRYAADCISIDTKGASALVTACAGLVLQKLVDRTVAAGLKGLETMTGIPGWLGAAVYGNAGAYGHSISESVSRVDFFNGAEIVTFDNAACQFDYRESVFKKHKDWIILTCSLHLAAHDPAELQQTADGILSIRNQKYPPTMKCAGSIFKNFIFAELPAGAQALVPPGEVRGGKVPSAWFLDQAGAKGLRIGDIQVAGYHANLIYNDGAGTAHDLIAVIELLKKKVRERFEVELEEEVQYVGSFD
jgi:UDP-N-acetylmuramate dehydrogenase